MTERRIELINVKQFFIAIQDFEPILQKTISLFNELYAQCFKNTQPFYDYLINMTHLYDTSLLLFSEKLGPGLTNYRIIFMLQVHSENFKGNNINVITDVCTLKSERKQGIAEQCFGSLLNEKKLEYINIPTILWVDRRTKFWQNAFKLYQRLGFRKFTDEENDFFKDYPGLDLKYITLLRYQPSNTVIQQIQQSKQISYYRKLFIHYDIFTNLFVTKYKYCLPNDEYVTYSDSIYITKDKKHIFIKKIDIDLEIDTFDKPKNLIGICFNLQEKKFIDFLKVLFEYRKEFTLIVLNFNIIEIYWMKTKIQIDIDYIIQSFLQFGLSNLNQLVPLYAPNGEIFALLRCNEISLYDEINQTSIIFNAMRPGLPEDVRKAVAFGQPLSSTDRALVLLDEGLSIESKISRLSVNRYYNLIPSSTFLNTKDSPKILNTQTFINKYQKYQQKFQRQQGQQQQQGQGQLGQQQTKQGQQGSRMQQQRQREQQGQQRQQSQTQDMQL